MSMNLEKERPPPPPIILNDSEKNLLWQLYKSPNGLKKSELNEYGFKNTWIYNVYNEKLGEGKDKLNLVTKESIKDSLGRGRPVTIFKLTDEGKKKVDSDLHAHASADLSYVIDLGSENSKISLSFDAHSPEDKHRYEAYWLANPPLITPFLRAIDFNKPTEVKVSLRIKIPSTSEDVIDATRYFGFLEEKMCVKQYWFWNDNINWLETSVAKGQGVWNTPYEGVGEACDLLMKSSYYIFVAMMMGLTSARKQDEIYHQVILRREIYNLRFAPINIFEFLLTIMPYIKNGKGLEFSNDHLGMKIFSKLLNSPEVKKWIQRCLKRDGRNWLSRIPFEKRGFQRNKEHVSDSWIFDTNFPLSLGVFFSMEKEKWRHIGAVMNILLDTIMLKKLPSRLGDILDHQEYTDDVILEAWDRVKEFWYKLESDPRLKKRFSKNARVVHKNLVSPQFLDEFLKEEKKLRYTCCAFLETVNQKWKDLDKEIKGTRELPIHLPKKCVHIKEAVELAEDKVSAKRASKKLAKHKKTETNTAIFEKDYWKEKLNSLRPQKLNPRVNQYKEIRKTIRAKTRNISSGKKLLRILGSGHEEQKMITTEEYNPDKELSDYVEKLDYNDLTTKLAELSKACPQYIEHL